MKALNGYEADFVFLDTRTVYGIIGNLGASRECNVDAYDHLVGELRSAAHDDNFLTPSLLYQIMPTRAI